MNVLLITTPRLTGISYYRQFVPHFNLKKNYGYKIDITHSLDEVSDEQLKDYQIVSFLRHVDLNGRTTEVVDRAKKYGATTILDIDDYWKLSSTHELTQKYSEVDYEKQCLEGLKSVDWVTTTTEHFADKIKETNENVVVIPNAIDPDEPQYNVENIESERVRIGWVGGVYHAPDITMMHKGINEVWKGVNNTKFQFCLGGFNSPNPMYEYAEFLFTGEGRYKDEGIDKPYRRLMSMAANQYNQMYNELDVCLVPLKENNFNSFKSPLKIIEAGWFKKAVIVSNVQPYVVDCNNRNSITISPNKRNEGWGVAMKSLILNKNKREDLGEALHEVVKDKYMIWTANEVRHQLYQSCK